MPDALSGPTPGIESGLKEALPHNGNVNALAIPLNVPNLIEHWSAAPTRFLGWIGAIISNAAHFAYRRDPGRRAGGCPPPDRHTLQKATLRRRMAA